MLRRKRENSLWISELQVINIKSFADSGLLKLSKGINVIVGKNNAGKSTLFQSVLCLQSMNQQPFYQPKEAIHIGASESTVRIRLQDIEAAYFNTKGISDGAQGDVTISFTSDSLPRVFTFTPEGTDSAAIPNVKLITNQEPNNFILPYTMKRFTQGFN